MRVVFLCLLLFLAIEHSLGTKQWPNPLPNEVKPNQTNGLQKPTNPTDKAALEEFYHSTAGPAWLKSNGWLAGDPCQSMWYRIRCNSMGDVIEIALGNNQLAGELPCRCPIKHEKLDSTDTASQYHQWYPTTISVHH